MPYKHGVIDDLEFAALMARFVPWPERRRTAVAVSGGADSLCLAWLTHRWGEALGLIIDHGLRPESATEARLTQNRLASFGMAARVTRLDLAPGPGLADRARKARYAALTCMAAEAGIADVLIGHHAGDQAETVLMRALGQSGRAGLAAMASIVEQTRVRLVRPLLGVEPSRHRATLTSAGLSWIEDPSNDNPAALRTRLRRQLRDGGSEQVQALAEAARRQGEARARAEVCSAAVLARRASIHPEGYALLSPGPIDAQALAQLIRAMTGAPYAPSISVIADLADNPRPATCAGVQILAAGRLGSGLLLVREAAAMAAPVTTHAGATWDRRFCIEDTAQFEAGTRLGALGADAAAMRRLTDLPAAVLRTMPALRRGGKILSVPFIDPAESCAVVFSPATPLAGGPFFM
jgi:tRNA(Ile)-lysidine synthase